MRKTFLVLSFLFLICSITAAERGRFGVGIILGEPTGISAKQFLAHSSAIDAAAAWSFKDETAFHLHADYLYHDYSIIPVSEGKLPLYYGIGGRIKLSEDPQVGVRIPVGLSYEFESSPLEVFLELVPLLDLVPETDFDFNGAVGVRYYIR